MCVAMLFSSPSVGDVQIFSELKLENNITTHIIVCTIYIIIYMYNNN